MRIVYGLCGEGMGHATRSRVAIEHLRFRGHDTLVFASGRAFKMMADSFPGRTIEIVGLTMQCADGALDLRKTIEENARKLPSMLSRGADAWREVALFEPHASITDFDSFAWAVGKSRSIPTVSIDNAQILTRCHHEPAVFGRDLAGVRVLTNLVGTKAPECDHYIVTSFFRAPVRAEEQPRTTIVPPILRQSVLETLRAPPPPQDHVLVYKTMASASAEDSRLLAALGAQQHQRFLVYGLPDGGAGARTPPNCEARPLDERSFVRDLASARAVIGNGGMSLIGEALAFGKPVLAVPVRGQYEQVVNAAYLERLGYGARAEQFDDAALYHFLRYVPRYAERIAAAPQHDGNALLRGTLDRLFG